MTGARSGINLRKINFGLSLAIVLMALYIVLLPFLPTVGWWFQHSAPIISRPPSLAMPAAETGKPLPKDNRLIIPKIDLDQHIFEGTSPYTVNKGVWIRPNASRPDIGSNTVMVAHRLTYTDPRGPFYFLNKLAVGDEIAVTWQQKVYHYKVESIKVVSPTDVEVEAPTKQSVLTLYTCTPLWTLSSRLVIRAGLEQAS